MKYFNLIQAFNDSDCDKNHLHKYAVAYDYILNSQYLRKGSPLNMLEVGIRQGYSIDIWDRCPLINNITGIDKITKERFKIWQESHNLDWNFSDKTKLIFNSDAYSEKFVKSLGDKKYDVILDDGDHIFESQIKFFNLYYDLLSEGGVIICEDITQTHLPQLQQLAQQYENFYVFDLRTKSNAHGNEIIAFMRKESV
jgi:predicted O-methyltransferase YrrM